MTVSTSGSATQETSTPQPTRAKDCDSMITSMDPKLHPTPAYETSAITPAVGSTRNAPLAIAASMRTSMEPSWDLTSGDSPDSTDTESTGEELDVTLFPSFDYGMVQYCDVSFADWEYQSTMWASPDQRSPNPCRVAPHNQLEPRETDTNPRGEWSSDAFVDQLVGAKDLVDNCTRAATQVSPVMDKGSSCDSIPQEDLVRSCAGPGETVSSERSLTGRLPTQSCWPRRHDFLSSGAVDFLIVLLSTVRRSTMQKRLSNKSTTMPQCVYSYRFWDPYRNDRLFATLVSFSLSDPSICKEPVEGRVTWLDSVLESGGRPEFCRQEWRPRPGSDYHYTLMNILQEKGGSMNLLLSCGKKMDRIETLRRELSAIVPYRSEDDRRNDALPKLWLQSVWQILHYVWRSQQPEPCKEQRTLKRKRGHGSSRLCDAQVWNLSGRCKKLAPCMDEHIDDASDGRSPHKEKDADGRESKPRRLHNIDLNGVLEEEKARRLKAKTKEITLLQRFGLCLDLTSFEISAQGDTTDEENHLGVNHIVSPKALMHQHSNGQSRHCRSPSSVDGTLVRKRDCDDNDPIPMVNGFSHKEKKSRVCDLNDPGGAATKRVTIRSTRNSRAHTSCEGFELESSVVRSSTKQDGERIEYDDVSDHALPRNDSQLERTEETHRSPIVYDDVVLSDRAKLLLQNLERRRHANVEESTRSFPSNEGQVQQMHAGLRTVTPKLPKQGRKRLKKDAKKKKEKKRHGTMANPRSHHRSNSSDGRKRVVQEEAEVASEPPVSRRASESNSNAISWESSLVTLDTNATAQKAKFDEECAKQLYCEDPRFPEGEPPQAEKDDSTTPNAESKADDEDAPSTVLCSESFLEQWGELIRTLASGCTHAGVGDGPKRKIRFVDTDLIDDVGIDIEFQGRMAVMIALLSQTKKVGFESMLRRTADVAAASKYKTIHVFLCADINLDDASANGMVRLQNATMNARGLPSTAVFVHLVGPGSLASSIFNCLLLGGQDHHDWDGSSVSMVEQNLSEPRIRERVRFLMSISPSISLGNAFRLVDTFGTTGNVDSWFPSLLSHAASERRLPHGIRMDQNVLKQLSFALCAPLGAHR